MISVRGRFESELVVRGEIDAVLRAPFWERGRTHHYVAASDGTIFRVERHPTWRFECVVAGSGKWQVTTRLDGDADADGDALLCFTPLAWIVVTSELAGELPSDERPRACQRERTRR